VYDIAPVIYVLQAEIADAYPLQVNSSDAIAMRAHSTHGELWLHERFAIPAYPASAKATSAELGTESTAFSPLVWLRAGAGWEMDHFRFAGAVSIISDSSAARLGLFVVLHWRPAEAARQLEVRWQDPENVITTATEQLPPWSLLSASRAPLTSPPKPGWWTIELRMHTVSASKGRHAPMIGTRKIYIFTKGQPIPAEAYQLFFHSAVGLPGEFSPSLSV